MPPWKEGGGAGRMGHMGTDVSSASPLWNSAPVFCTEPRLYPPTANLIAPRSPRPLGWGPNQTLPPPPRPPNLNPNQRCRALCTLLAVEARGRGREGRGGWRGGGLREKMAHALLLLVFHPQAREPPWNLPVAVRFELIIAASLLEWGGNLGSGGLG